MPMTMNAATFEWRMKKELETFYSWYMKKHKKDASSFPDDRTAASWEAEFEAWRTTRIGR